MLLIFASLKTECIIVLKRLNDLVLDLVLDLDHVLVLDLDLDLADFSKYSIYRSQTTTHLLSFTDNC